MRTHISHKTNNKEHYYYTIVMSILNLNLKSRKKNELTATLKIKNEVFVRVQKLFSYCRRI